MTFHRAGANNHTLHVFCRHCAFEIEACGGVHGEWMHVATRFERCGADGRGALAEPEMPQQIVEVYAGKRKRGRAGDLLPTPREFNQTGGMA